MLTGSHIVQDVDVSGQMSVNRNVETGLSQIWWTVLRNGGCLRPDDSRGLVLDVGANFGYYALYAAAHGCRYAPLGLVIFWLILMHMTDCTCYVNLMTPGRLVADRSKSHSASRGCTVHVLVSSGVCLSYDL